MALRISKTGTDFKYNRKWPDKIQSALHLIIRLMTTCSGHWQVGYLSGHAMNAIALGLFKWLCDDNKSSREPNDIHFNFPVCRSCMKWDFILRTVSYTGRHSTELRTRFIIEIQIGTLVWTVNASNRTCDLFSSVLIFFVMPAHPVHMINLLSRLGVAPAERTYGIRPDCYWREKSIDSLITHITSITNISK